MQVRITLKGLKPGQEVYEESRHLITADTDEELQANITQYIYEFRQAHQYYKIKYTNIEEVL